MPYANIGLVLGCGGCDRSVTCQKPDLHGAIQEFELCCVVDRNFRLISHVFVVDGMCIKACIGH